MNVSECRRCGSDVIKYVAALDKRIASLEMEIRLADSLHKVVVNQRDAARNQIAELEAQRDDARKTVKECHELAAKRVSSLEKALETIADEYRYQVGFDEYYENAMDVFYGRGEA